MPSAVTPSKLTLLNPFLRTARLPRTEAELKLALFRLASVNWMSDESIARSKLESSRLALVKSTPSEEGDGGAA